MLVFGALGAWCPLWLAFTGAGTAGVVLVIAVQFGVVFGMGVYNPVAAAYRLEHTEKHLVARVLAAWSVSTSLTTAALTAAWGGLAALTSPRIAIAVAGVLLLATPFLLPRRERVPEPAPAAAARVSISG